MDVSSLEQFIHQFINETRTPGVAVALTDRERTLRVVTCGYADVAAQKRVSPDTLFQIGSVSKSFTAVALMQQADQGRFDPELPISHYLPWFQVKSSQEITGHHCLTHSAGLPNGRYDIPDSLYQLVSLRDVNISVPLGQHWVYSNLGYVVLTHVLEKVSGKSYATAIQEGILTPLGMTATEPVTTNDTRSRIAVGYEHFYDDRPEHSSYPLVPARWVELCSGDGSVSSTPCDMAAYVRMMLNRGVGKSGRILTENGFARLTQPAIQNPLGHYAYGLNVFERNGCSFVAHNGNSIGYGAWMIADMTNGLGVVVMINGPARGYVVRNFAYRLLLATKLNQELPLVPPATNRFQVPNAAEYVGIYGKADKLFHVVADGERLLLETNGNRVLLEPRERDLFYVDHADYRMFLLRFGRDDGDQVVEAFHGPDWYTHSRYEGNREHAVFHGWGAYPGYYRTQHPYWNNFWIVLRKGNLVLVHPFAGEQLLVPLETGEFRVGDNPYSPERVSFDTVVDGMALRLRYSGCDYFRVSHASRR